MTSTPLDTEAAPDVRDLDASAVLDVAVSARRAADAAEVRLLALAVHWVDLHPVTAEHPAATFPTQRTGGLAAALGPAFFAPAPLAGGGTPGVAEYAVEELAAALGLSHPAGLSLVSEAVELCHRLPRLWALVQDGRLQAWRARQVAKATTQLSREAVAFVDRHLAVTARSNRLPVLNPVIHEARLRCDPDQAAAVAQNALDHRGVWLDHRESTATTLVTARMDTLDPLDLDATVGDLAGLLGRLGDDRTLGVRRASVLGMLAHPQRALDLAAGTESEASAPTTLNGSRGTLYLHVCLADLATTTGGGRHPQNLACLCRRHHRAKTFAGWRYRRLPDDDAGRATYEWTSPHLRTYRVTPHHLVG